MRERRDREGRRRKDFMEIYKKSRKRERERERY
jgi:hypothetical protein